MRAGEGGGGEGQGEREIEGRKGGRRKWGGSRREGKSGRGRGENSQEIGLKSNEKKIFIIVCCKSDNRIPSFKIA